MISPQARQGIEHIFIKSARAKLLRDTGDRCEILPVQDDSDFVAHHIVVLTISSFRFRLTAIFHIDDNAPNRDYFVGDGADRSFTEVFAEFGNLCCGGINRELLPHFPDLGMSTPNALSGHCAGHLAALRAKQRWRYAISINQAVRLNATLCMTNYGPLDFVVDTRLPEEAAGELELF